MRIEITKHQLILLQKRNAASESAQAQAKTAQIVAQQAQGVAQQMQQAFTDVVSCISAENGNAPGEYAGVRFGEEEDAPFLELIEQPKGE